uniref:Nuclear pore complex protein n=1 Tax=Globodera pallida TaxID=36090 RepID=A0A183C3J2_GLOPA
MLAHQLELEGMQHALCSHQNNNNFNHSLLSYNIFALKDALDYEQKFAAKLMNCGAGEHSERQRVLGIVQSLWDALKYLKKSANLLPGASIVNGLLTKLKEEETRFIGVILWHFVFRENPIFDACDDALVFFARLTPNIDPTDVVTTGEMVHEMEKQLEARDAGLQTVWKEQQFFDEYTRDLQLFEQLEGRVDEAGHQRAAADADKRFELGLKLHLLRTQYICMQNGLQSVVSPLPLYNMIDRAFIVFGKDAPALILLIRALLERKMNGDQLENYLKDGQNVFNYIKTEDENNAYIEMASKLGNISKEY